MSLHVRGADRCKGCCCGISRCQNDGCDGVVHRQVVDEIDYGDGDWTWVHDELCDKCGERIGNDAEFSFEEEDDSD